MLFYLGYIILCLLAPHNIYSIPLDIRSSTVPEDSVPLLTNGNASNPQGDTLGVIRCYCMSKDWEHNDVFGYYYLWEYYNFHTNHRFYIKDICFSGYRKKIPPYMEEEQYCLMFRPGTRRCQSNHKGGTFCYELNGKESLDRFTYNGQRRGLPVNKHEVWESSDKVREKCDALCHDISIDMRMMIGRAVRYANTITPKRDRLNSRDNEWSHITFYPEVDDMCHGCK